LVVVVAEFKVPSVLEVANTDATQLRAELGIPKQTTKLSPPVAIPRAKAARMKQKRNGNPSSQKRNQARRLRWRAQQMVTQK
jgi:hypothetical protein